MHGCIVNHSGLFSEKWSFRSYCTNETNFKWAAWVPARPFLFHHPPLCVHDLAFYLLNFHNWIEHVRCQSTECRKISTNVQCRLQIRPFRSDVKKKESRKSQVKQHKIAFTTRSTIASCLRASFSCSTNRRTQSNALSPSVLLSWSFLPRSAIGTRLTSVNTMFRVTAAWLRSISPPRRPCNNWKRIWNEAGKKICALKCREQRLFFLCVFFF